MELGLRIKDTFSCAAIDAFTSNAVDFGLVPKNETFPNVIIAKIFVLVIRRVEVCEVSFDLLGCL